ncbi:MAG: hypothetical protein KJ728_09725 [Alphaproteobacteria bacterium]|jgi:hypothetical protein|uniref:Uncharacterized protein n=1 Tax=Brevundimonas mediterranea TaxID=74329 RepID=A0A7W6A4A1_9CAUL|nr:MULTISPECIES: hypothetical protein [Brevundimonas]MBU1272890.1 hypothetical protein [Alphaproteobacteria bacterium]MBB3871365.1 hypothetical protein [Brevundimonas mediterranea]MBJ7317649.1 hypothetical protein [Brevundimonas sp.]MBU1521688.1 hypothetical protein [Alphaproteobacteria bacterium]MBU2031691.1 hypothetical protein [Alphaproteobacteria bacterium]
MTPEKDLEALFALDAAPRRDPAFEAMIAKRIARRRAVAAVGAAAPLAVAGGALLWGLRPVWSGLVEGAVMPEPEGAVLAAAVLALGSALAVVRQVLRG